MNIERTSIKQISPTRWSVRVYYNDKSFKNSYFSNVEDMLTYLEDIYDV